MQITLNQDEIEEALVTYVRGQINLNDDQEIGIDFKAGRGDNGYTATLDIRPRKVDKAAIKPKAVTKTNISTVIVEDEAPEAEPETASTETEEPAKGTPEKLFEVPEEAAVELEEARESSEEGEAGETDEPAPKKATSIFNFDKSA